MTHLSSGRPIIEASALGHSAASRWTSSPSSGTTMICALGSCACQTQLPIGAAHRRASIGGRIAMAAQTAKATRRAQRPICLLCKESDRRRHRALRVDIMLGISMRRLRSVRVLRGVVHSIRSASVHGELAPRCQPGLPIPATVTMRAAVMTPAATTTTTQRLLSHNTRDTVRAAQSGPVRAVRRTIRVCTWSTAFDATTAGPVPERRAPTRVAHALLRPSARH